MADGKTVSPYLCVAERAVHSGLLALNAAGLIGRVPRSAFAASPPGEASSEPIAHWIAVRRRRTLLAARTLRCRGDYRAAAACTVIFAGTLVGRAESASPGVLVPEETFMIGELQPELSKAGISVADEQASTTARAA